MKMKEKDKQVISFIGIGAQKSGTSWLSTRLSELPGVSTPPIKELHYFDRDISYPSINALTIDSPYKRVFNLLEGRRALFRMANRLRRLDFKRANWLRKWYLGTVSDRWYLGLFKLMDGIRGEITPAYSILNKEDIERMYNLAPNAKIIFLLRNPVERAWSHYRHMNKWNKNFKFDPGPIDKMYSFLDSPRQDLRSNYIRTIDTYLQVYPREQFLVCFYDSIADNPSALMKKVASFIGVDPDYVDIHCELGSKNNVSPEKDMPLEIHQHLLAKYKFMMKELSDRYGGYCSKWYSDTYPEEELDISQLEYTLSVNV